jgi:adenosylmethionine-8-amino-7-oxononanoate aminotransferase
VNFIGHGVREISAAMAGQAAQLEFVHTSQFTTPIAEEYAEALLAFAGPQFRGGTVYFTCGGSESIETALKLARQYQVEIGQPGRYQVLSRQQSYHGSTLGALSVSGNKKRREIYLPMVKEFSHVSTPYCYRCRFDCTDGCYNCGQEYARELEHAIAASDGEAAGFIFEPVSGATLGAVTPPLGYLQSVAEICRRHGVLLIADEVMTGMGRTGRNFAVEHWDIAPDILVTAKGLSSGYAPLGAVLASKKVTDAIAAGSGAFLHGFTYNAHPISLAAGRAVLQYLRKNNLVAAADDQREESVAHQLRQALDTLLDVDVVGDVRGIGLLLGVEFVADKKTKQPFPPERGFSTRVGEAARKRGLLVYPMQGCVDGVQGDHLLLAPPAVITEGQIAWAVEQLRAAIRDAAAL